MKESPSHYYQNQRFAAAQCKPAHNQAVLYLTRSLAPSGLERYNLRLKFSSAPCPSLTFSDVADKTNSAKNVDLPAVGDWFALLQWKTRPGQTRTRMSSRREPCWSMMLVICSQSNDTVSPRGHKSMPYHDNEHDCAETGMDQ